MSDRWDELRGLEFPESYPTQRRLSGWSTR